MTADNETATGWEGKTFVQTRKAWARLFPEMELFLVALQHDLKRSYRLFSFWDKDVEALVVATHGIIKKTQKTPSKEIDKAEEVRRKYFEAKKKK